MAKRTTYTVTLVTDTGDALPDTGAAYAHNSARAKGLELLRAVARSEGQTYSRQAGGHYVWIGDRTGRVLTISAVPEGE